MMNDTIVCLKQVANGHSRSLRKSKKKLEELAIAIQKCNLNYESIRNHNTLEKIKRNIDTTTSQILTLQQQYETWWNNVHHAHMMLQHQEYNHTDEVLSMKFENYQNTIQSIVSDLSNSQSEYYAQFVDAIGRKYKILQHQVHEFVQTNIGREEKKSEAFADPTKQQQEVSSRISVDFHRNDSFSHSSSSSASSTVSHTCTPDAEVGMKNKSCTYLLQFFSKLKKDGVIDHEEHANLKSNLIDVVCNAKREVPTMKVKQEIVQPIEHETNEEQINVDSELPTSVKPKLSDFVVKPIKRVAVSSLNVFVPNENKSVMHPNHVTSTSAKDLTQTTKSNVQQSEPSTYHPVISCGVQHSSGNTKLQKFVSAIDMRHTADGSISTAGSCSSRKSSISSCSSSDIDESDIKYCIKLGTDEYSPSAIHSGQGIDPKNIDQILSRITTLGLPYEVYAVPRTNIDGSTFWEWKLHRKKRRGIDQGRNKTTKNTSTIIEVENALE